MILVGLLLSSFIGLTGASMFYAYRSTKCWEFAFVGSAITGLALVCAAGVLR